MLITEYGIDMVEYIVMFAIIFLLSTFAAIFIEETLQERKARKSANHISDDAFMIAETEDAASEYEQWLNQEIWNAVRAYRNGRMVSELEILQKYRKDKELKAAKSIYEIAMARVNSSESGIVPVPSYQAKPMGGTYLNPFVGVPNTKTGLIRAGSSLSDRHELLNRLNIYKYL